MSPNAMTSMRISKGIVVLTKLLALGIFYKHQEKIDFVGSIGIKKKTKNKAIA
jgi:hypothetical protein